jgi:hypothetical protein
VEEQEVLVAALLAQQIQVAAEAEAERVAQLVMLLGMVVLELLFCNTQQLLL